MHILPPELHALICQFAAYPDSDFSCANSYDPGHTIRNLSLVSKYFYEVSKPYLFNTVCITKGAKQASSLVKRLEALVIIEGDEDSTIRRIGVRWMYVCDSDISSPETASNEQETPKIISRLLALTSSTLYSLAFISTSQATGASLIGRVYRIHFPLLKHLTISGYYPFPSRPFRSRCSSPTLSASHPALPSSNFPSLTSLVLHGNVNPSGIFTTRCISDAFPSIDNLTVSGVGAASNFYTELGVALDNLRSPRSQTDDNDEEIFQASFPPTLRFLTIEAIAPLITPPPVAPALSRPPRSLLDSANHRIMVDFVDRRDELLNRDLSSLRNKSADLFKAHNGEGLHMDVKDRPAKDRTPKDFFHTWLNREAHQW